MRVLLDTHALLWWLAGDLNLSKTAREVVTADGTSVFVSAASAWEIATKHRLGKLPGVASIVSDIDGAVARQGFIPMPVTILHGQHAGTLPGHHRDPFDRMLVAQALTEDCLLVSNETVFERYGVRRLW